LKNLFSWGNPDCDGIYSSEVESEMKCLEQISPFLLFVLGSEKSPGTSYYPSLLTYSALNFWWLIIIHWLIDDLYGSLQILYSEITTLLLPNYPITIALGPCSIELWHHTELSVGGKHMI